MSKAANKKYIENIMVGNDRGQLLGLFAFDKGDSIEVVAKKFNLFVVRNYDRYYTSKPAEFHKTMIQNYIKAYKGDINFLNIGFRGCAKTSLAKLFITFVILNDQDKSKKYIKILTKELRSANQLVTDIYNLLVEVIPLYGDPFEKQKGDKTKREETMQSFTLRDGRKIQGGTVGQTMRGAVQDAHRPDFYWLEDIEDSESIRSLVKTQTIIDKCDEAIQALDVNGSYFVTANYISDTGVVEWLIMKDSIVKQITPIIDDDYLSTWSERYSQDKILEIKKDANDWTGDYMCNPESSDSIFFDREIVDEMLKHTKKPIKKIGLVDIWADYKPNHTYVIGGDTSAGVGLDSNALTIFDLTKSEVIGAFHSNTIQPDMFGHEMVAIGNVFGGCLLAPEINNTGHAVITVLKDKNYTKIYKQEMKDKRTNQKTERLGWNTNTKTKHEMWSKFKTDYEDGNITIYDEELLKEMRQYTREDFMGTGLAQAVTRHFDLLTSAVIAWACRDQAYFKKKRKIARRKIKNTVIGI